VVGALTIHSSDRDAFDEDETVLLDEVALDLGHGIATLRARRAQERVSAELNEQRARTRAIYDHLPHAAFVWRRRNETFSLIDVNNAARAATDSGVEQHLAGDSLGDFADLPHLAGDLERCYSERGLVRREVACTLPGASRKRRFVLIYGYMPPDMVLLHAEDVTDLRQAQEQLAASQRLEAIGRLAGGVAHDFNNLLSVILSHAEFATQQLDESDPVRADVEQIREAGLRAAELTRRLLAFGRKQVLTPKPLNLNDVVRGMESMLHRLLGEDVVIDVRLAAGLGTVMADPGQIEQVIMNLAVNSRHAMPDGGSLTIETADVESGAEAGAEQSDRQPGPWVSLTVTDTGHGMDSGTRTRVFEPFFTTREPGAGTGLGLSTVYGIVKQSSGRIDVVSEPGTGTRFTVCLPRIDAVAAEVLASQTPAPKTGTETILVAEDEASVRNAVERILRAAGYTVIMAKDALEAIRFCEQHDGALHLLLTDVVMPGMNGRDLADRLRLQRPSLGILLMSGYAEESALKNRAPENRLPFMGKPFTAADLTARVREVLDAQAGV
jgi:signal transduction histidine kinase/CheY-like chemotaxis protein